MIRQITFYDNFKMKWFFFSIFFLVFIKNRWSSFFKKIVFLNLSFLSFYPIVINFSFFVFDKIRWLIIWLTSLTMLLTILTVKKDLIFFKKPHLFIIIYALTSILFLFFTRINLIIFFFRFEIALIPIIIIILGWGRQVERLQASNFLIIYTIFFSIFFMFRTLNLISLFNRSSFLVLLVLQTYNFSGLFLCFIFIAFLVKLPIFFLHKWLPKAHVEAPVFGSVILARILLKIGVYGLTRFYFLLKVKYYYVLMILIIGCVLRNLICFWQRDLKSLVAYSSIGHITITALSLFINLEFRNKIILIIIFRHGVISSSMFIIVEEIYQYTSSRNFYFIQGLRIRFWSLILLSLLNLSGNLAVPPSISFFFEWSIRIRLIYVSSIFVFIIFLIVMFSTYFNIFLFVQICHGKIRGVRNNLYNFNFLNLFFCAIFSRLILFYINIFV